MYPLVRSAGEAAEYGHPGQQPCSSEETDRRRAPSPPEGKRQSAPAARGGASWRRPSVYPPPRGCQSRPVCYSCCCAMRVTLEAYQGSGAGAGLGKGTQDRPTPHPSAPPGEALEIGLCRGAPWGGSKPDTPPLQLLLSSLSISTFRTAPSDWSARVGWARCGFWPRPRPSPWRGPAPLTRVRPRYHRGTGKRRRPSCCPQTEIRHSCAAATSWT